jgi:hypothetical protein
MLAGLLMLEERKHPTLNIICRSDGMVFVPESHHVNYTRPAHWTKGCIYKNKSYEYYVVSVNGKRYKVHRLICEAFHKNPEQKPFVDHIDRNPKNNKPKNLRFANAVENRRNREDFIQCRIRLNLPEDATPKERGNAACLEYYRKNADKERERGRKRYWSNPVHERERSRERYYRRKSLT